MKTEPTPAVKPQIVINVEHKLHALLKKAAAENSRTMRGEVGAILKAHFAALKEAQK